MSWRHISPPAAEWRATEGAFAVPDRRAFGTAATSEEVSLAKSSGDGSPSRTWPLHQMPPGAKLASSSVAPRRQRPFSSSKCREEQFLVPMANYCYLPNYTGQWRGT